MNQQNLVGRNYNKKFLMIAFAVIALTSVLGASRESKADPASDLCNLQLVMLKTCDKLSAASAISTIQNIGVQSSCASVKQESLRLLGKSIGSRIGNYQARAKEALQAILASDITKNKDVKLAALRTLGLTANSVFADDWSYGIKAIKDLALASDHIEVKFVAIQILTAPSNSWIGEKSQAGQDAISKITSSAGSIH